jgi:hypothetical protein
LRRDVISLRQTVQILVGPHSHYEVRATLQVETETNVGAERGLDA